MDPPLEFNADDPSSICGRDISIEQRTTSRFDLYPVSQTVEYGSGGGTRRETTYRGMLSQVQERLETEFLGSVQNETTRRAIEYRCEDIMRDLQSQLPFGEHVTSVQVQPPRYEPMAFGQSEQTWRGWNTGTVTIDVTTTSSNVTASTGIWNSWNNNATTGSTSFTVPTSVTIDPAWEGWQGRERVPAAYPGLALTPEETRQRIIENEADQARMREQREASERQYRERAARRSGAEERAEALLHSVLSASQVEMLTREGRFMVECNSGRVYEIKRGTMQNVFLVDRHGKRIQELCAHLATRHGCPTADHMVAQFLFLLQHEDAYRKVSNIRDLVGLPVAGGHSGQDAPVNGQVALRLVA